MPRRRSGSFANTAQEEEEEEDEEEEEEEEEEWELRKLRAGERELVRRHRNTPGELRDRGVSVFSYSPKIRPALRQKNRNTKGLAEGLWCFWLPFPAAQLRAHLPKCGTRSPPQTPQEQISSKRRKGTTLHNKLYSWTLQAETTDKR